MTQPATSRLVTEAANATVSAADRARGNHTGTQSADTITDGTTNKAFLATERTKLTGIASGATVNRADSATDTLLAAKADLVSGLVPTSQIPAIALTTAVTVASQAAMLALTTTQVQPGDVAVRTDGAGTFILTATDPTVLGNWVRLNAPTDAVTTVNGQTGTVVLAATDVGAAPASLSSTVATNTTNITTNTTAIAGITLGGTVNAITGNATAVAGVRNTVSTASGPVTVTLPTPTAVGQHLIIERLDASTANPITISGTIRGVGAATAVLPPVGVANEGALWIAESLTSWVPAASIKSKAFLDAMYAPIQQANRVSAVGTNAWAQTAVTSAMSSTAGTSRTLHPIAVTSTDIVLEYDNIYLNSTVDAAGANVLTVRAGIEVGGSIYRVTFNGSATGTIDPGGFLRSDPVPVDITAGTVLPVRTYVSAAATPKANTAAYKATGTGGFVATTDLTAPGSAAVTDVSAWLFGPKAVLGTPLSSAQKSVLIVGDSIASGLNDASVTNAGSYSMFNDGGTTGGGYICRGIGATLPWINVAVNGDTASNFALNLATFGRMRYAARCTHAIVEYGRNDLTGGNTLAQIQGNLLAIWTRLNRRGLKIVSTTITPNTTSTDTWATTVNQTVASSAVETVRVALNGWLRAGSPIDPTTKAAVAVGTGGALLAGQAGHPSIGYYEITDLAETARNSGIWKAAYTPDGLHPNPTGAAALAAGVDLTKLV